MDPQPVDALHTLLITLTGRDRPGVTSAVFRVLSAAGVEVVDIEQIVLRGRLVLGVLVTAPRDPRRLREAIESTAAGLDMQLLDWHGFAPVMDRAFKRWRSRVAA